MNKDSNKTPQSSTRAPSSSLWHDDKLRVECPDGTAVTFFKDGRACLGDTPFNAGTYGNACDMRELNRTVAVPAEAQHLLDALLGIKSCKHIGEKRVNLLDIALRHRFAHGYDDAFFQEVKDVISSDGIKPEAYRGLFLLPRDANNREALLVPFLRSKLPDAPSVRKACARRPAILGLLAQSQAGRIFSDDPNLAVTFISADTISASFVAHLFDGRGQLNDLISIAAEEELPTVFVRKMMRMSEADLTAALSAYDKMGMNWQDGSYAWGPARKDHTLNEIIGTPRILESYLPDAHEELCYNDSQLALQGTFDGFTFYLPKKIKHFVRAGDELRNCLSKWHGLAVSTNQMIIVLVKRNKKLVAAMELNPRTFAIVHAYGKANRTISPDETLWYAIEAWCRKNEIEFHFIPFL